MSDIIDEEESVTDSASERDELLKRWVKQPPTNPNMQYLRDAERSAALQQLGDRTSVLDLASEVNVTKNITAESVTRLDFSQSASSYAQRLLDGAVDRFAVTDPEWPQLPFEDSTFEAAISVGPFDWKFLDVDVLIDELHRVTEREGEVVFTVPTPRSPYSEADSYRFRYFDPDEARRFIPADWRLVDWKLLFQYPEPLHSIINKLPDNAQRPFADLAWELSDQLTDRDWWDYASYLVMDVERIGYEQYLTAALDCLFRSVQKNGFWDNEDEKIIRALEYSFDGDEIVWTPDDRVKWRYAPFAVMGVMRWRASALGDGRYDSKIHRELDYFTERIESESTLNEIPSYGIGPLILGFALGAEVFGEARFTETAWTLYKHSKRRFEFTHAEDSLLLFGWSHLYRHDPDEDLLADIANALWRINERLTPGRLFQFDNSTTHRHQNQMYTLWGLCEAIRVTGTSGYLDSAEQVIEYAIENRMRDDGAFLWDEVSKRRQLKRAIHKRVGGRPPHWDFLYECHQTFFVNAVNTYYAAGGTENYDREVREAMGWIYGNNPLKTNLVAYSGLGVPMRQMTVDGRLDVEGQMYKGAYEIGSYIMALTDLLSPNGRTYDT